MPNFCPGALAQQSRLVKRTKRSLSKRHSFRSRSLSTTRSNKDTHSKSTSLSDDNSRYYKYCKIYTERKDWSVRSTF